MKSHARLFKRRTKRFFRRLFEVIFGYYPQDNDKIREENIKYIFTHTINWMDDVASEYDTCYNLFKNHEQAKLVAYRKLSI